MQNYYDVVDRNGKAWDMSTIFMKKDIQWVVKCCLVRITPKKNGCDYEYREGLLNDSLEDKIKTPDWSYWQRWKLVKSKSIIKYLDYRKGRAVGRLKNG